jgi:hypothetical protein
LRFLDRSLPPEIGRIKIARLYRLDLRGFEMA